MQSKTRRNTEYGISLEKAKKTKKDQKGYINQTHLLKMMFVSAILFTLLSAVSAKDTGECT